jgi:hypothetical protein
VNRYYLVNLAGAPTRLQTLASRFPTGRPRACDRYHYRVSNSGAWALVQGYTSTAQHNTLMGLSYVQQSWPGDVGGQNRPDPALLAYLEANPTEWGPVAMPKPAGGQ